MCIVEGIQAISRSERVLNNSMSKLWDKIKKELKKGCTVSMSDELTIDSGYKAEITIHKGHACSEIYFTADIYDFEYEYVRRKLDTKKWNNFIHQYQANK